MNALVSTRELKPIRPMVALVAAAALVLSLAYLALPGIARADGGTITWGGNGSELLPCDGGAHWVLSPADGIESATLHVGNASYNMTQSGQGSWSADSAGTVPSDQTQVWVAFTGPGDEKDHLQLSHCLTGEDQGASLLIRKRNAESPFQHLAGGVFTVEINGNVIGTFTTDSNGAICLTGLPKTVQATVTEITPPPGFDLPSDPTQVVWVDDNDVCQSAEAIFKDEPVISSQSAAASSSTSASSSAAASSSTSASSSAASSQAGSPEGSVEAATGSPAASVPNTSFSAGGPTSGGTLLAMIVFMLSLSALAMINVRRVRQRR